MQVGQRLGVMGPFGQFQFKPEQIKHAVFIAGGIGVTPMLGMARTAADLNLPTPITFFYSNKTVELTACSEALSELEKRNPNLKMVFTLTHLENCPHDWRGEKGRFCDSMLLKHVPDYIECSYFICGPVKMTQEVAAMLSTQLKIPSSQIHVEGWG
jgi:ferredoxin-NADP reductase